MSMVHTSKQKAKQTQKRGLAQMVWQHAIFQQALTAHSATAKGNSISQITQSQNAHITAVNFNTGKSWKTKIL